MKILKNKILISAFIIKTKNKYITIKATKHSQYR